MVGAFVCCAADCHFTCEMGHHHPRLGSLPIARVLPCMATNQKVTSTPSEADMQHTTINRHSGTRETVAAAFWLLAGIIVLIAAGDAFALLVAAVVIVTLTWGMVREIERRLRNHAELASVTHLRPASTGQRDPKTTPAQQLRRDRNAA
jgi:hypothetical protein